ncbi:hypothetical protein SLA_7425 [Streptomyces laurentii]|uniref:Uncharacterized protein n=1 Tax=Streptomyces laurentii TaxID=39478 RepID=A0A160PA70_STRLU|nr:hypothetical protein SLA_7425 [Streptomyces laurentii]
MIAEARICGGMLGRPFADGYMSTNISAGNSTPRCSARNANTLPAGINSRQVSHTSGPTVSPAHSPITTNTSLAPPLTRRGQNSKIFMNLPGPVRRILLGAGARRARLAGLLPV